MFTIATVAAALLLTVVIGRGLRRARDQRPADLGTVSQSWLNMHRAQDP
jgi:hypothetical protein